MHKMYPIRFESSFFNNAATWRQQFMQKSKPIRLEFPLQIRFCSKHQFSALLNTFSFSALLYFGTVERPHENKRTVWMHTKRGRRYFMHESKRISFEFPTNQFRICTTINMVLDDAIFPQLYGPI